MVSKVWLRGHRDDRMNWEDDNGSSNEANFIQQVRYRAETDLILANHLLMKPIGKNFRLYFGTSTTEGVDHWTSVR